MEKEEQICLLTQQNAKLEEKTTKQSQDLREKVTSQSQELTRTKQELTQKATSQSLELTQTKQELTQTKQELTRTKQDLAQKAATQELTSLSQELTRTKHKFKQEVTSQVRKLTQELSRSKQELMQEQTRTKHELTQKATFQAQELTRTNQELSRTKQELTQKATSQNQTLEAKLKEAQRQAIDRLQTQQQRELQELRAEIAMQRDILPVTIKMAGFDELKKKGTDWHSCPFYTGVGGHKMCLRVYANGTATGAGTHVSVFTCLMCGEFDSHLKWPFRGTVTFQLVNQLEDKEHRTDSYAYSDLTPDDRATRVTDGDRSGGLGRPEFLPHSELGLSVANNRQYLKDDCLIFRFVSVKLN